MTVMDIKPGEITDILKREIKEYDREIDVIGGELQAIAATIAQQPQLLAFFSRPWVATAAKRGTATEMAARLGLSPLMRDFLALVAGRNRVDHLVAIAAAYRELDDGAKGRVRVNLRTVVALTDGERQHLRARLSRMLDGKELVLAESVDPQLLGGFVAEVGSRILDGSLDTQLERMRNQLART